MLHLHPHPPELQPPVGLSASSPQPQFPSCVPPGKPRTKPDPCSSFTKLSSAPSKVLAVDASTKTLAPFFSTTVSPSPVASSIMISYDGPQHPPSVATTRSAWVGTPSILSISFILSAAISVIVITKPPVYHGVVISKQSPGVRYFHTA